MRDITLTIGGEMSELTRTLEQAAQELNRLRGTADITGKNLQDSFELATMAQKRFREQIRLNEAALGKTRLSLRGVKDEIRNHVKANRDLQVNMNDLAGEYQRLVRARDIERRALTANERALVQMMTKYNLLGNQQQRLAQQTVNYRQNLAGVTIATDRLKNANRQLAASKGSLGNAFKRTLGIANQLAGVFGFGLGLYGLMRLVRTSTSAIVGFDEKIRSLAAISGATAREMEQLSREAIRLGSSSKYGAEGVSEMMTQLAKMGFAVDEIQSMSAGITRLATASGEELAPAAETVASIIRAMGLDARDTTQVVDTLALSFTRSALDLSKFRESMKYVAPLAKQVNFTLEDTASILALLADNGISGSLAGTSLRNVFSQLSDSGSELNKRFGGLAGDFDEFIDRMIDLKDAGLEVEDMFQIIDRRAVTALSAITDNLPAIRNMSHEMKNASGAADEMANIQMQAISYQAKLAKNAYDGFILAMDKGDGVLSRMIRGTLTNFTHRMNDITRAMQLQSKQMQDDVVNLSFLERAVSNSNNTMEDRLKIVQRLNQEYPEMFAGMKLEADNWGMIEVQLRKALDAKRAYLDIQFQREDVEEEQIRLERLRTQYMALDRDVISLVQSLSQNTQEFENIKKALDNINSPLNSAQATAGQLNQTIKGTTVTYRQFQEALRIQEGIDDAEKGIDRMTEATRNMLIATIEASEGVRANEFAPLIKEQTDRYVGFMNQQTNAAVNSGEERIQAMQSALEQTKDLIEQEIQAREKRIIDINRLFELERISYDEQQEMEKRIRYEIEQKKVALEGVLEAHENNLNASQREMRQTEQMIRLEWRLAEARARVALDGIALEEELSRLRLKYMNQIADATMSGDELDKNIRLNQKNRIIEQQQLEVSGIRHRRSLEEAAHKRKIEQMQLEQQLSAFEVTGTGQSAAEIALNREMALLNEAVDFEQQVRDKQRNEELKKVEQQLNELNAKWEDNNPELIEIKENLEKEKAHIEEKYNNLSIIAARETATKKAEIEIALFEERFKLMEEERRLQIRGAELSRRVERSELEHYENLWDALDILGNRTRAQRALEKQHAIDKEKEQLELLRLQEEELKNQLAILEVQRLSEGINTAPIDSAIAEIQRRLGELNQDIDETLFTIKELERPGFTMSEWQEFISSMKNVAGQLTGIYQGILDERNRIAAEERALLDRRISETQRDIEIELRAAELGHAANVQNLMKSLEQQKKARDKALQEEKQAAKEKMQFEKMLQTVNLLTAVSNVIKQESRLGLLGIATAAAGLGGLWMLWGNSINRAQTQKYEKGGSFLLNGKSHARGGELLAPGHEAQSGELVSVFNRSATKKYGSEIRAVTDMFNKGKVDSSNAYPEFDTSDIKAIRKLLEGEQVTYSGNYKIIKRGNKITRCRLN